MNTPETISSIGEIEAELQRLQDEEAAALAADREVEQQQQPNEPNEPNEHNQTTEGTVVVIP